MPVKKFKKGRKKTGGRKKGVQNKFTTLKQSFLDAYNSKEMGGTKGMTEVFAANSFTKREFYKLISKMLPTNIDADLKADLKLTIKRIISTKRPPE